MDLVIESLPPCGTMIIHNACIPPRSSGALPDGTKSTSRFNEYLQDINTTAVHDVAQRCHCRPLNTVTTELLPLSTL